VIVFLVLIATSCVAEPDSITTGPYNITFDIGLPKDAYNIKIDDPVETESLGGEKEKNFFVSVENKSIETRTVAFSITEYAEAQPSAILSSKSLKTLLERMFPSANIATRTIDGKEGALAEYTSGGITMYFAMYFLDKYTWVQPMSGLPWDEGTLQLLKTLHVEKINETSQ